MKAAARRQGLRLAALGKYLMAAPFLGVVALGMLTAGERIVLGAAEPARPAEISVDCFRVERTGSVYWLNGEPVATRAADPGELRLESPDPCVIVGDARLIQWTIPAPDQLAAESRPANRR